MPWDSSAAFREREGDRVRSLEHRDELGLAHDPGYFRERAGESRPCHGAVSDHGHPEIAAGGQYKSPNTKPPSPAAIMPDTP